VWTWWTEGVREWERMEVDGGECQGDSRGRTAPRATAQLAHGDGVGRGGESRIESGSAWNPQGKQRGYGRSGWPPTRECSWNTREMRTGRAGRDTPSRAEKVTAFAKPTPLPPHCHPRHPLPSPFIPLRSHTPATCPALLRHVLVFPLGQSPIRSNADAGSPSRPFDTSDPVPSQTPGPPHAPGV
jgi:hypothetical protein